MLKEVYVLQDGVSIFHHSSQKQTDEMHYVLSSGFLAAIQSFTVETRASKIDFFASQDEFFIFDEFNNSNKEIVCIFSNTIQHTVGREILNKIKSELSYSDLVLDDMTGNKLPDDEEKRLEKKIDDIANSTISVEYQAKAAKQIFDDNDAISLLILYDYRRDILHFKDAQPSSIFDEEDHLLGLRSLHRYIMAMIKEVNIGIKFNLIVVESDDYVIVISKYKTILCFTYSDSIQFKEQIYEVPFQVMSLPGYKSYISNFDDLELVSKWRLTDNNKLHGIRGQTPYWINNDILSKGIASLERILSTTGIDQYMEISIFCDNPSFKYMKISRRFTFQEHEIDIYS